MLNKVLESKVCCFYFLKFRQKFQTFFNFFSVYFNKNSFAASVCNFLQPFFAKVVILFLLS
jgi:hypothetical protein